MTQATALGASYIVAARRTALGRPGGLHKGRRIESLTAPVLLAALKDAHIEADAVDEIILGNTTAGDNPARLVGLAAGLGDNVPALTVDRQCASGLDAILLGMRAVALGEASVVVAGGAESLSTAP
jgi:acetyl-CoA C-acetyltransferase